MTDHIFRSSSYYLHFFEIKSSYSLANLGDLGSQLKKDLNERIFSDASACKCLVDKCIIVSAPRFDRVVDAKNHWTKEKQKSQIFTFIGDVLAGVGLVIALSGTSGKITAVILSSYGAGLTSLWAVGFTVSLIAALVFSFDSRVELTHASDELTFWENQHNVNTREGGDLPSRVAQIRSELFEICMHGESFKQLDTDPSYVKSVEDYLGIAQKCRILSFKEASLLAEKLITEPNELASNAKVTITCPQEACIKNEWEIFDGLLKGLLKRAEQRRNLSVDLS